MLRKLLLPVLFVAFLASQALAQQTGSITGTVTNEQGDPVPTANVLLVEISRGAATNLDGEYTISNVEPGTYTLRVTFVGYQDYTEQVTIEAGQTLEKDITLSQEAVGLSELVVTAFGIQQEKRSLGYQTETVSTEEINAAQPTTAAASLIGKVAGLQVNNLGGGVRNNQQIILRGLKSITGDNSAQIVIDGSRATMGAFQDLNPNSIESINVLKGATAAALYGSDAVNGVLVVSTKDGQRGTGFKAGVTHSTTWQEVKYVPDHQTKFGSGIAGDYVPYENTNWGPRLDGQMRRIGRTFPAGYQLDAQMVPYAYVEDQLMNFFETGSTQQNTIYLSGGNESSSFYLAFGNLNRNGVIPHDEYSKKTFTANAMKDIGGGVTLNVNANYIADEVNVVGNTIGAQDRALYWFVLNTPINIPIARYKNWQDPTSYGYHNNYYNGYYQNPYGAIGRNRFLEQTNRIRGNISASWDIVDNINVTGRLGVDSHWGSGTNRRAALHYDQSLQPAGSAVTSFIEDFDSQNTLVTGSIMTSGQFDLNDDFGLDATLGTAVKMMDYRYSEVRGENLSIPGFWDISNATGKIVPTIDEEQYRTYGFFGTLTLDYKQWAYLNLSGRQDYTSTLPSNDNAYFYPGIGVSIILSDAVPAISELSFLSFLKVTANYSVVYNDLQPYAANEGYFQSGSFPFGSINGFYLTNTAVDNNIQKEKITTTEFGLNAAFLENRLTLDVAYYFNQTQNVITSISPSVTSGATSFLTNIGKLAGNGLEISLGADVIRANDFTWNVKVNYTSYQQKVEEIKPGVDETPILAGAGWGIYAVKGEVYPQLKVVGYKRDNQGRIVINPETGNPVAGDLKSMGQTTPEYILGFNTSFHYKGLAVRIIADYRADYVYYSRGFGFMSFTGRSIQSASANRQNFVFPNSSYPDPNGSGYIANTNIPISGGQGGFWRTTYDEIKENYVRDATALKLRTVAISYSLPTDWLGKTGFISEFTVSLIGRNLLTIRRSDETVFSDPEYKTDFADTDNAIGVGGYFTPPPQRSYGFSVNIEF